MSDDAPHDLVSDLVQSLEPGVLLTKWLLVAEVIGEDGQRRIVLSKPSDLMAWDALGLLRFVELADAETEPPTWVDWDDEGGDE